MRIAIRFDGGGAIGFGHATRCLSLVRVLREKYALEACAYIREDPTLENYLRAGGMLFESFPQEADETSILGSIANAPSNSLVVIDRLYPYARAEIAELRAHLPVFMLHNECEGMSECNCVIFPVAHLSEEKESNIRDAVRRGSFYTGFDYVLLGEGALQVPKGSKNGVLSLTSGASDPAGILIQLLDWMNEAPPALPVCALYGNSFVHMDRLKQRLPELLDSLTAEPFSAEKLFGSEAAISVFGVSSYELLYHGVPFITIAHIPKTAMGSAVFAERLGLPIDLGLFENVSKKDFQHGLEWILDSENRKLFQEKTAGLVDGQGVYRVAALIADLNETNGR